MGWAAGSEIYDEVIMILMKQIPEHKSRKEIHKKLIEVFEAQDCDTLSECMGKDKAFDEALKEANPDDDFDKEEVACNLPEEAAW